MAGGMSGSDAYFLSCDIDLNVKLKIGVLLDERKPAEQHQQSLDELETEMADDEYSKARRLSSLLHVQGRYEYYVTCQLFADNGSPISLPARTKHASFSSQEVKWSEWLTLPVKYCDLPVDAVAAITVWDVVGPLQVAAIGGTTVPLFDRQNMELQGQTGGMKLQLWPHCQADPAWRTTTPYQIRSPNDMDRLSGLEKEYDSGSMPRLDWLDRLAFQAIDRTKKQIKQTDDRFFVSIEFPMLQLPVLFFEKAYTAEAAARSKVIRKQRSQLLLDHKLTLPAVDFGKRDVENPVQLKHRVMSRIDQDSNSKSERDLTPSRQEKDDIARILLDSIRPGSCSAADWTDRAQTGQGRAGSAPWSPWLGPSTPHCTRRSAPTTGRWWPSWARPPSGRRRGGRPCRPPPCTPQAAAAPRPPASRAASRAAGSARTQHTEVSDATTIAASTALAGRPQRSRLD